MITETLLDKFYAIRDLARQGNLRLVEAGWLSHTEGANSSNKAVFVIAHREQVTLTRYRLQALALLSHHISEDVAIERFTQTVEALLNKNCEACFEEIDRPQATRLRVHLAYRNSEEPPLASFDIFGEGLFQYLAPSPITHDIFKLPAAS